jgi:hypothetical protein
MRLFNNLAGDRTQNRFPILLIASFSAIRLIDGFQQTAGPKKDQEKTP